MTPRLYGQNCKFFTTPLPRNSQRLAHKLKKTKLNVKIWSELKPASHVRNYFDTVEPLLMATSPRQPPLYNNHFFCLGGQPVHQCSPYQAVTGKISRLKQHFLLPATAWRFTKIKEVLSRNTQVGIRSDSHMPQGNEWIFGRRIWVKKGLQVSERLPRTHRTQMSLSR